MPNLRFAVRQLSRSPGFTIVAVVMLALGIGANTAIFSFINAFFLRGVPFARPEELVALYTLEDRNAQTMLLSHPNFLDYRRENTAFVDLASHSYANVRYLQNGAPTRLDGEIVTGNYFDLLGIRAAAGRTFNPEEYQAEGTHPVVVVSHAFWQNELGASPAAVGRTVLFNDTPFTVVGVAPPDFRGVNLLFAPNFWVPTAMQKVVLPGQAGDYFNSRRAVTINALGRLRPGVTLAQASAAMAPIAQKLAADYPAENAGRSLRLLPLEKTVIHPNARAEVARAGTLLLSFSAIVLLIACANLANLLLARAAARQREISLRLALGASRGSILRELLVESGLLAVLGGLAGIVVAYWTKDLLWSLRPNGFPADFLVKLDGRVLGFTLLVSLGTGLLFGLAPAWTSTRVDLIEVLKRQGLATSGRFPLFGFRNLLVAGQVALAVVALVVAGLFIRSLQNAQTVELGWNAKNLLLVGADVGSQGYDQTRVHDYHVRVLALARSVPGVTDAAIASRQFLTGLNPQRTIRPQGSSDEVLRTRGQFMSYSVVTPGYLRFMGLSLSEGRDFTADDDEKHPAVVIINEALARRAWPGESVLGKTVKLYGSENAVEVVGVVRDGLLHDLSGDPTPYAFFPYRQQFNPSTMIHIRTAGDPAALMATLQKEFRALDPAVMFYGMRPMDANIANLLWGPRTGARLMSVFGGLGLLLAALGVYAIMAHSVAQRTREIGIRMAIGAQARDVLSLVFRRGMVVTMFGLGAGLILAFVVARHFQKFFFHMSHADPVTYGAISVLLILAALLACWLPARRALKVNPITALRND